MIKNQEALVYEIRSFNRFYTNILGLLDKHILDSPYSLTEVRILLEIKKMKDCTANKLTAKLSIDRGYMSRVLKRFENDKLIAKESSVSDRRRAMLYLTQKGKDILAELESRSDKQVKKLIGHLSDDEQQKLVDSMKYIKESLLEGVNPVTIRTYRKEDISYVIRRHRELYEDEYSFGDEFGDYVEKYVTEFDKQCDTEKENIWIAETEGKPVGMIAIVKVDDTTAQLRWFLIEPHMRGIGLGYRLMKTAVDFCREKGYNHVFLWTVSILEAARTLYKGFGFRMTESKANDTWGGCLVEERWDMNMDYPSS